MLLRRYVRALFAGGLVFFQVYAGKIEEGRASVGGSSGETDRPPTPYEVPVAREPGDPVSDIEAYKNIFLATRRENSGGYDLTWKVTALRHVVEWDAFIKKYPESKLVPQAYIRMAEWYLTITTADDARVIDPVYASEALRLLNDVIKRYPKYDHLTHLGNGQFAYQDTIEAFALFTRGQFFPGYCKSDYARLKRDYPNSTLTHEMDISFKRICRTA